MKRLPELRRILHVDDDDDIGIIAALALEEVGQFTVCRCESGQAALDKAPGFGPDLFLLDYMMPDMDGQET
ncbi:MAG: response regulator, partial [Leeuwenhoekiella sp.]